MNLISLQEAYKMAIEVSGVPHTLEGLTFAGMKHGFIIKKKDPFSKYNKIYCDKDKLKKYLKFVESHYTLLQIAITLGTKPGAIHIRLFQLNITGVKKYGKKYYTKKQAYKIIKYCKENQRSSKKRIKK